MKYVLTIAGFDPSNGAGLTADIKTFEAHDVYGLSVCTAITIQHESEFLGVEWVKPAIILHQVEILFDKYPIDVVKIGLVENVQTLQLILGILKAFNPTIKIVWDPILQASAGFVFHENFNREQLLLLIESCYLITPNLKEWQQLFPDESPREINQIENILLKGGHAEGETSTDTLYTGEHEIEFIADRSSYDKHGTGCVLSASITANLTKGLDLPTACELGKAYVTNFINSSESLLGWHDKNDLPPFPTNSSAAAKNAKQIATLQVLTQDHKSISHESMAEAACKAGAKWIQLRIKDEALDTKIIALNVQLICKQYGAKLIINDNVALAQMIAADGVHLGKNDMPPDEARQILGAKTIIGGTANTMDDIRNLAKAKVDYIGVGPFRFTTTKKQLSPVLGLKGYRKTVIQCLAEGINIPLIAIGGITVDDVEGIMETGVHGIALASAVNLAEMPEMTCKIFLAEIERRHSLEMTEN